MNKTTDTASIGIANTVRAEAARANIEINKLSAVIGRSQSYTYDCLHGRRAFTTEDLSKIAAALGMPLTMFFDSYMLGERIRQQRDHEQAA